MENYDKIPDFKERYRGGDLICEEGYTLYISEEIDDFTIYKCEGGSHIYKKKKIIKPKVEVKVNRDGEVEYG